MDKFGLFLQGCSIFTALLLSLVILIAVLLALAYVVATSFSDKEMNPIKYNVIFYSTMILIAGAIGGGGWLLMP